MTRKLDDDIDWHLAQIERLNDAIAMGEPLQKEIVKTPLWGPKGGGAAELPTTLSGMRRQLEQYEQTLRELEEQRGRGD